MSVVADEQGKSRFGKQSDLIIQLRFGTSLVKASTANKAKAKLIFGQYIVLFVNMKCLIFNQIKKKYVLTLDFERRLESQKPS